MATSKDYLNFILDQFSDLTEITSRPMMGEYLLYYRGRLFGDVCDNRLYLKPVPAAAELLPGAAYESPYPGAKEMLLVEELENRALLARVVEEMYPQLPPPRPKKKRQK